MKEIEDLTRCHKERSIAKFFGVCNDFKVALLQCCAKEKKRRVSENVSKAQIRREKMNSMFNEWAAIEKQTSKGKQ